MGPRPLFLFLFFECGDRFYTSESDVYRRKIVTYKDGPRTEWVNPVRGCGAMARAPDYLASHACVPVSRTHGLTLFLTGNLRTFHLLKITIVTVIHPPKLKLSDLKK